MNVDITISTMSGTLPYSIYLCDDPITTCLYIDNTSTLPYTFTVPSFMSTLSSFNLKIIDSNGCITTQNLIPS